MQDSQRHAVVADSRRWLVVYEDRRVVNPVGADGERPVIARGEPGAGRRIELEQTAVADRAGIGLAGEVRDLFNAVPQPEEHRVAPERRGARIAEVLIAEHDLVCIVQGRLRPVRDPPAALLLVPCDNLDVEALQSRRDDRLQIGRDLDQDYRGRARDCSKFAAAHQPTVELGPDEHGRLAGVHMGDLYPVEVMLKARIPARFHYWTVALGLGCRLQRHLERATGRAGQPLSQILARLVLVQPQQPVAHGRVYQLRGVRAPQRRFN